MDKKQCGKRLAELVKIREELARIAGALEYFVELDKGDLN